MLRGEKLDTKEAREFIERNEEFFKIVEKALKKDYIQLPLYQDPRKVNFSILNPELSRLREIVRFCVVKANFLFYSGKEEEAFNWLLNTADIGKKLIESPCSAGIIGYLVGKALYEISYRPMRDLIPKSHLAPSKLSIFAHRLLTQHSNIESDFLKRSIKMEYMSLINTLNDFIVSKPHNWSKRKWREFRASIENVIWIPPYVYPYFRFLFKPNKTRKDIFVSHKEAILNIGKLYKEVKLTPPLEKESRILKYLIPYGEDFPRALFKENSYGKILAENLSIPYSGLLATFERECHRAFSASAIACIFALKAYKEEKGHLPDSLSELVPKYLPKIPIDPFDGKPLRYSKEKGIIYCVDKDLKDSGGSPKFRQTPFGTERLTIAQMDDPTIELGFK